MAKEPNLEEAHRLIEAFRESGGLASLTLLCLASRRRWWLLYRRPLSER